ncbi:cobalamin (vitamin B12) biosynthesis CbiM protein [Kribbella flavida DSM 17836]|uniref:Cobalamin (Vitamin B12) biosynthesis CbiM protein n=1 Tax=Kribbella flavida (strain DSM 17836 / JCM 10339 / NBRC 14399) TaxID=479435 RepID=D2PMS4_KRIFD|nr:energy-coupling factor ABC transporter permease [Kribbella flavida]ADB32626.1 cobalamin (vitamin B12) biosynthesis CbiM protein [Kribbella flavida DSM 17836]
MHVPDGFFDAPTSLATGLIAAGAVGVSLRRANQEIRETGPALAGLTAAFVFAVQMVNFPVGAGTSGHLLGGVLAAALVGPWTAVLVMSTVLLVQGLLFADGGLTALGTNITLMGLVTVLVGYFVTRALIQVLPKRVGTIVPSAALGALVSVPAAALAFTGLYAAGGAVEIPLGQLMTAMVGWHVLIGLGEAVITAAVLSAVVATRPDLVYAARHLRSDLVLVGADGNSTTVSPDRLIAAKPAGRSLGVGVAVTLLIAGFVSLFASAHPDGLEFVGGKLGFESAAKDSAVAGSPLADYGVSGIGNGQVSGALAGIIGVLVTIAVGLAVAKLASLRSAARADKVV